MMLRLAGFTVNTAIFAVFHSKVEMRFIRFGENLFY